MLAASPCRPLAPVPVTSLQCHVHACVKALKGHKCMLTAQVPTAAQAPRADATPVTGLRLHVPKIVPEATPLYSTTLIPDVVVQS